jgi:ribosomal protein S18 acetylase RimI-like enzyme
VSDRLAVRDHLVAAIEQANVNAFPSERLHLDRTWLVRLSPGNPARRVNSLNIHDPGDGARAGERIRAARAHFARNGVPFHLRVTPLTPPEVVARADQLGWSRTGETDVWARAIPNGTDAAAEAGGGVAISDLALEAWLSAFAETGGTRPEAVTAEALASLGAALSRVVGPRLALVARDPGGSALGVAMAIVDGPLVGIYDVAVAPAARRRGLGARLVRACLGRGVAHGAATAWLQVTAENAPARALYAGLGFTPVFSYHYRRPADGAGPG